MTLKEIRPLLRTKTRKIFIFFKKKPWLHILAVSMSLSISIVVLLVLKSEDFKTLNTTSTLSNILTVNGVFSAILITYLFTRITWAKDRKLEVYKDAISLSRKITEYRRILNKLTYYYQVWRDDKSTKTLVDSKFDTIDFYDYKLYLISDYIPRNKEVIDKFRNHPDFREADSTLYLAMVSLVKNRNIKGFKSQHELYKDFQHNKIYNIKIIEKWIECEIFGTIWYWLDQDYDFLNYQTLKADKEEILSAISRINIKYEGRELNNKLLKDVSDDFTSYYISELYVKLKELRKGITDLNLIIIILISTSLIFGVMTPFSLLLISSDKHWFSVTVGIIASLNSGLISYFILRFPTLINKELKWV